MQWAHNSRRVVQGPAAESGFSQTFGFAVAMRSISTSHSANHSNSMKPSAEPKPGWRSSWVLLYGAIHKEVAKRNQRISSHATAYSFRHARFSELLQIYGVDPLTVRRRWAPVWR